MSFKDPHSQGLQHEELWLVSATDCIKTSHKSHNIRRNKILQQFLKWGAARKVLYGHSKAGDNVTDILYHNQHHRLKRYIKHNKPLIQGSSNLANDSLTSPARSKRLKR